MDCQKPYISLVSLHKKLRILELKLMERDFSSYTRTCRYVKKPEKLCMSQYLDSFFLTGGFIYYRESNVANFWDRFNVLEHGSTDSLTTVFRAGAYLGKQFLITRTFIQFCGFINIFVKYQLL